MTAATTAEPAVRAAGSGVLRGLIEFRHVLTTRSEVTAQVGFGLMPIGWLIVIWRAGETVDVGGQTLPYVLFMAPGMFAIVLVFNLLSPMYSLAADRENGTLLRARTLPYGLVGYSVGRVVAVSLEATLGLLLVLVPALVLFEGLRDVGAAGWATFAWVFVLGLAATVPYGLIIGSLLRSTKGIFSIGVAVMAGLTIISGVYQPLQVWAGWVQGIAQALPVYWLGHGMRAAFLPDAMAGIEVGGTWRLGLTAAVLAAWAVVGLVLAPLVLRRAARRQTASRVMERRDRALATSS